MNKIIYTWFNLNFMHYRQPPSKMESITFRIDVLVLYVIDYLSKKLNKIPRQFSADTRINTINASDLLFLV